MSSTNAPYINGNSLLSYLRGIYPNREVITAAEFRDFLQISAAADLRMRKLGKYPRVISVPGVIRDPRIMLIDLAAWLERGGSPEPVEKKPGKKRGRGSEAWKKNHPAPEAKALPENSPASNSEEAPEAASTPYAADADLPPAEAAPSVSELEASKADTQPGNPPDLSPVDTTSAASEPVATDADSQAKILSDANPAGSISLEASKAIMQTEIPTDYPQTDATHADSKSEVIASDTQPEIILDLPPPDSTPVVSKMKAPKSSAQRKYATENQ